MSCLAAITALLLAQDPAAQAETNPRLAAAAAAAVEARGARIRTELGDLGAAPGWAGSYYQGDGLGFNVVVVLAPTAGYTSNWSGCLGTYDQDHGSCTEREGRIVLVSAFPDAPPRSHLLPTELVPVRWGERRYLIPPASLLGFANAVNGGGEPRGGPHGSFLLRRGDDERPVRGRPELPEAAMAHLLAAPVTGTITAVGDSRIEASGTLRHRITEATIDRGATHGLRQGHVVHFLEPGFGVSGGVLVEVTEHSARIRTRDLIFEQVPEATPKPAVGWKWSTRWRNRR